MKVWSNDYVIRQLDLPYGVKGFVALDDEGFPNIYVNSRLTQEEQYKAAAHELAHIAHDDFYSSKDIRAVEGL
jgi:Zn-dependent peptidase ImmA (M78 family)